jgi:hypothetical protein
MPALMNTVEANELPAGRLPATHAERMELLRGLLGEAA